MKKQWWWARGELDISLVERKGQRGINSQIWPGEEGYWSWLRLGGADGKEGVVNTTKRRS